MGQGIGYGLNFFSSTEESGEVGLLLLKGLEKGKHEVR